MGLAMMFGVCNETKGKYMERMNQTQPAYVYVVELTIGRTKHEVGAFRTESEARDYVSMQKMISPGQKLSIKVRAPF